MSTCSRSIRAPPYGSFVAKATGVPVAKVAAKIMAGESLASQGYDSDPIPSHVSVKESVFPFVKFPGVDIVLGPEMRSTGEVMGVSDRFSIAFAKSQLAAGVLLPKKGNIFIGAADPPEEGGWEAVVSIGEDGDAHARPYSKNEAAASG